MNDLQTEMCLKWIVILIAVKQRVPAIQTESCDKAINRLTNRDPTLMCKSLIFLCMPQEGADLGERTLLRQIKGVYRVIYYNLARLAGAANLR